MRILPLLLLLGACGTAPATAPPPGNDVAQAPVAATTAEPANVPDESRPTSEVPIAETSAQGAATVLEHYFTFVGEGNYGTAWRLWSDGGRASGLDERAFAASFAGYRDYRAHIGAPGEVEGAAGSLYVEIPLQIYGRRADETPFNMSGRATLRRENDVPGSTEAQRRWQIAGIDVTPD